MNRISTRDFLLGVLLVACGVAARMFFRDLPNFAPVAAMALFAGYLFGSRLLALSVPILVMTISDFLINAGGYALSLRLTVYGLLVLPVFFGGPLRSRLSFGNNSTKRAVASMAGLIGCSVLCSLLFFAGTNWMVWMTSSWYEPTIGGLLTCFANAVPFFKYTLAGDLCFATVLFGVYALTTSALRRTDGRLVTA